ncbi:thioredoxin-disulfide reductase [candidate division KSB1 bacterium]|nr:thioredoxin-disulfide reductase [candidate division KSB1 bacterium]NIR69826.1 thioredoxin-disulfide reductase [candidate division KSB1 bacterium]NIS24373.1 thioredoxin-disulfide reductase [candidate division KSB1 bacterium]NIT71309.1 thioredoxin-disulfide reductase [candidate division KSB1 bacterium]NIU27604.1 thioredoxin-disulfide reductase [candidate division KSB1 bacterium]
MASSEVRNIIIIGSGPAGYTAALYNARAMLEPLVFAGPEPGGQLTLTTDVENYPGFPDGIMGPDLMEAMKAQAERFGAEVIWDAVTKVDFSQRPFSIYVGDKQYLAKAVIISSGASAKMLGLESEKKLLGHGVSTCATCDGAFFRDQNLVVVGGGDTAMEDSTFLTKFAKKVEVVHRRDELRASKIMQEKAFKNEKIDFIWDTVVEGIHDPEQNTVTGVTLKNVKTGETTEKDVDGVFIAIGHKPNTDIFQGQIDMDDVGYIKTREKTMTNVPGVFAAGDVVDYYYRQAVTAAGMGCRAGIDAERWLEANE